MGGTRDRNISSTPLLPDFHILIQIPFAMWDNKHGTYLGMYSWCCAYDCAVQFITFTVISVRNTAVANAHFSEAWVLYYVS